MRIKIYQINPDRDEKRVKFLSYKLTKKYAGKVDPAIYDLVWQGEVSCDCLEVVYSTFNLCKPADFKGHSMSVSDVVEVDEDGEPLRIWFCDSFGFVPIAFDYEEATV